VATITCRDKDGILVTCSRNWWNTHIEEDHESMIGCEAHVKATVENPYRIDQDARHTNRKIFYKPFILPRPFHTQYLRVVIEYRKGRLFKDIRGYIITAFPCKTCRKGDILIWKQIP